MIATLIIMAITVLFLVICLVMSIDEEYKSENEKKLREYEFMDLVFNDLKKSKDCYITDIKIEEDILYLEYWYYGEDSEEKRLEKVKNIVKEDYDFYGPIIGIKLKDIDVKIRRIDFVK